MVVLGFQLVSTLIGATTLSKLFTHFSFGQWLLCRGLVQHLHPTNKQLKEFAGLHKLKDKNKKPRRHEGSTNGGLQYEEFHIAKSTPVELETKRVNPLEVSMLNYYWDYQCLVDYTLCALLVYGVNEFANHLVWGPTGYGSGVSAGGALKLNLSLLWLCVGVMLGIRALSTLARLYLRTPERGEMMVLLTFTSFFLVLAMGLVLLPEKLLRLGIVAAHSNFTATFRQYRASQEDTSSPIHPFKTEKSQEAVSLTTIRVLLVVTGAFLGGLLSYPGLRLAKMYQDALRYTDSPIRKMVLHVHFFWPMFCLFFWVGHFRDQLLQRFPRMEDLDVDCLAFYALWGFCILRACLMHPHLQAYLHMAQQRVMALRKEVGRITNVEYQRTVWSVFRCLAIVALQYVAPVQILLLTACLHRNLAGVPWRPMANVWPLPTKYFPLWPSNATISDALANGTGSDAARDTFTQGIFHWLNEDTRQSVNEWTLTLVQLKALFTPTLFRGLLGFYLFWMLLCVQVTSLFGLVYHSYSP